MVVKVSTDQDGLYGYGCATYTQRADLVVPAVDRYLKPFLVGRQADRIDDLWQAMYNSSYWRNGPVLNNAMSGVDMALWDIKGRQAGMPVYQLLGGKMREAADCYSHASGAEIEDALDSARAIIEKGFRHVRIQVGVPGMAGYGSGRGAARVESLHDEPVFERTAYMRRAIELFERARAELGDEIELLHDVHERISPTQAVGFCKEMEEFRLFFLEDPVSPEDLGGSASSATSARRPSPWESSSTAPTSGPRSSPSGSSTTSGSTSPRPAASRRAGRWRSWPSCTG